MLSFLERMALAATRALSAAGLCVLLAVAASTIADGLLRAFAGRPIDAVRDFGGLVVAAAVCCCIPSGMLRRSHVTIRFIDTFVGNRAGRLADALAAVLAWTVIALIAWQMYRHAENLATAREVTFMLRVPVAPFWYVVDAILWCAVAVQTIVIAVEIGHIFGRAPLVAGAPSSQ